MLSIPRFQCRNLHGRVYRLPPLPITIPINVHLSVSAEVRAYLGMKNFDRKTRMFFPSDLQDLTVPVMRSLIEEKHNALKDKPYVLRLQLMRDQRQITPKGTDQICALLSDARRRHAEDKRSRIELGLQQRDSMIGTGTGPGSPACVSLQVFVEPKPGIFPPLKSGTEESASHPQSYLKTMADPSTSTHITLLSFYAFHPVKDPRALQSEMLTMWKPFQAVGRIYVAEEGVNGQLAVPSNVLNEFYESCKLIPTFEALPSGLFLNVDHEVGRISFEAKPAFRALHVRVRPQVLADGLLGEERTPLDWHRAGRELSAPEWNAAIENPSAIVLDCRNSYESDVGKFDGAVPLNTRVFKDSFQVLETKLLHVDRDTPVLTYCTGGIRCVKVNAYLLQRMGFTNVGRLQGGIVSYARDLQQGLGETAAEDSTDQPAASAAAHPDSPHVAIPRPRKLSDGSLEAVFSPNSNSGASKPGSPPSLSLSKFKGVNFVFDERMVSRITDHVISLCSSCGKPSDNMINCRSLSCHARFVQCGACSVTFSGCCSTRCMHQLTTQGASCDLKAAALPENGLESDTSLSSNFMAMYEGSTPPKIIGGAPLEGAKETESSEHTRALQLVEYCERMSTPEPGILQDLAEETARVYAERPGAARMLSGHLQGRMLAMLASLSGASSVLELGAFTGYSALCFAEAIRHRATMNILLGKRAGVLTCEIDTEAASIARKYFQRFHEHNREVSGALIDFRAPLTAKELIAQARAEGWRFDVVFIDADKRKYESYVRELLGEGQGEGEGEGEGQRCLLYDGALLLVDNTLWKGLVLTCSETTDTIIIDPAKNMSTSPHASDPKAHRQQMLAQTMHSFNQFVRQHPKLTTVLIPIRDGLSCIRYNKGK